MQQNIFINGIPKSKDSNQENLTEDLYNDILNIPALSLLNSRVTLFFNYEPLDNASPINGTITVIIANVEARDIDKDYFVSKITNIMGKHLDDLFYGAKIQSIMTPNLLIYSISYKVY